MTIVRPSTLVGALLLSTALSAPVLAGPDETPKAPSVPAPASTAKPAAAPATPTTPPAKPPADDLGPALAFADAVNDGLAKTVAAVRESSVTVWNSKRRGPPPATAPKAPTTPPAGAEKGKGKSPEPEDDGAEYARQSGGSGVIVTWKGKGPYVITNEHVIRGGDRLEIATFDGTVYRMKLIDHVQAYDIALLDFVKAKPKTYKAAKFGKSEELREGQWVIATGNPFFLGGDGRCVATLGVISGLERTLKGDFTYANAIQHDAEVNPGNSGGPLWDLAGELVGINGMISSRPQDSSVTPSNTGASYSIPIHLILRYLDDLLSDKQAVAGYLGLDLEDAKDPAGKPLGARVKAVRPDSPIVKKADPKAVVPAAGDVVTQIALGPPISPKTYEVFAQTDVVNALALYAACTKVKLTFVRAGKKLTWSGELCAQGGAK
jgi:serine protease Do